MPSNMRKRLKLPSSCKICRPEKSLLLLLTNGKGFRQRHALQGMGLQNMRYRVGAISGSLKITTAPHQGTLVKVIFPLRENDVPNAQIGEISKSVPKPANPDDAEVHV